ncbi:alanine racemase [Altererythrobacter sp. MF3-039]|uniref:alanine racemase n=1 Tax=Altererythrobacter sp. MF3-039 TaxID=3252901 RepID=UPI00390C7C70
MSELPPATLRLRVDAEALASNWRALHELSGEAYAGTAIKADCYGLGVDACVPALVEAGARDFFVAHWREVPDALEHVLGERISVLHGPLTEQDVAFAREAGVRPTINSLAQARRWIESGGGTCDLMVDTGINRLGLSMSEIGDPIIARLEIEILMSHLACADEDGVMNAQQLQRFQAVVETIPARRTSLANSAGIALGSEYHFDVTRPGLSLYGGIQRPELEPHIRQVARIEAAIIQSRKIGAGDSVGYNATFTADREMRIGVVSLGYADGILRGWAGSAFEKGGASIPMLGKVSMDMIVVDLTDKPDLGEGDWLELPYHLPDAAQHSGLSQYELLTVLGTRLKA